MTVALRLVSACVLSILAAIVPARRTWAEDEGITFFEKRIRPVFVEHCHECHSAKSDSVQGGLRVDSVTRLFEGGESGPVIVRGRPSESLLIEAIRYESYEMPPSGKLDDFIIADFERWIALGAPAPQEETAEVQSDKKQIDFDEARKHWAYQPLSEPDVPRTLASSAWAKRDTDHFIFEKLADRELKPSPQAEAALLLRRVCFDLTGLPPNYEDVVGFSANPSDAAYAQYVERLLASPAYGEHWGRQWMDVARYADTNPTSEGTNRPEPFAFGYRDWIIEAANQDLPYDRFIKYQIAADCYGSQGAEHLGALGFISLGLTYHKDLRLDRDVIETLAMDDWDDRVDALGRGVLGLSLSCARCHDHKFDAISQSDYYGLAGVFASIRGKRRSVGSLPTETDATAAAIDESFLEVARLRRESGKLKDKDAARAEALSKQAGALENETLTANAGKVVFALEDGSTWFERGEDVTIPVFRSGEMRDLPVYARGSVHSPGAIVPRRFPRLFTGGKAIAFVHGSGRLELAENLFAPSTMPLAARVIANRMWGWHFGQHLVATPSDFGVMGDPPTHLELLDYLAYYLIRSDWSLKALHREIVLSATYRQSARRTPESLESDESNRLLSRYPVRRLSAEQYRDAILKIAGTLAETPTHGPGFNWVEDSMGDMKRRSVYARITRPKLPTYLIQFNFPDPMLHSPARMPATSATQNLFLLNSSFMIEVSERIALRLECETDRAFVEQAVRAINLREPHASELRLFVDQLREWKRMSIDSHASLIHAMLITNEYLYLR